MKPPLRSTKARIGSSFASSGTTSSSSSAPGGSSPKSKGTGQRLRNLLPDFSTWSKDQTRAFVFALVILTLFMVLAGTTAFFFGLRGAEQTLVPEVKGLDITEALLALQTKELYPRITLRYTDDPADRNRVFEQSPPPGSLVKAGRRINLTISRGAVLDAIEDFRGATIDEARLRLQATFASSKILLSIREPVTYAWDSSEPGTILEQKPSPGTAIAGPMELDFIVSKGPERATSRAPSLVGLGMAAAVSTAASGSIAVDFSFQPEGSGGIPGTVVTQSSPPGTEIPVGERLTATIAAPEVGTGRTVGIFSYRLPLYPYPAPVSLIATTMQGERIALFSGKHPGGSFTVPYELPFDSVIVLSVLDREVTRTTVRKGE